MYRQNGGYGGGGFQSPYALTPMVKRLMIANFVIWLLQLMSAGNALNLPITQLGWIRVEDVFFRGFFWQPFTYMWLHSLGVMHLAFNMFALWMFGGQLEAIWGSRRFLSFYLTCGVGAGFLILGWHALWQDNTPTLGASGAIYGLLTAFSLMWPNRTIMLLFPPVPIKAIWFIPIMFVLQIAMGGGGNISHVGHLGGVLVAGFLLRKELSNVLSLGSLKYRWHRYKMRKRLHAVRKDEWDRRDDNHHTH